jgi:hypothetical protein
VRVLEDAVETGLLRRTDRGEAELFAPGKVSRPKRPKANSTTTMEPDNKSKSIITVYDPFVVTLEVFRIFQAH